MCPAHRRKLVNRTLRLYGGFALQEATNNVLSGREGGNWFYPRCRKANHLGHPHAVAYGSAELIEPFENLLRQCIEGREIGRFSEAGSRGSAERSRPASENLLCDSIPEGKEEVVFPAERSSGGVELRVQWGNEVGAYTARVGGEIDVAVPELYYPGALQAPHFRQDLFENGGRQHRDFEGRAVP